mmetsp:Transcript_9842/g.18525  ORF Transcript_9842/g.18525 Transcript_9842/m.18525 type:complete len:145 (-) Transcript_9842:157-591(-)
MFSRASLSLRHTGRAVFRQCQRASNQHHQKRNMGGGAHWMEISDTHTKLGEAFGFVCWMWIFHRARNDLPVVLGWRHPWEHAEDPWAAVSEPAHEEVEGLKADWDKFQEKASIPGDGDDDEEEDDDDEDEEEEAEKEEEEDDEE